MSSGGCGGWPRARREGAPAAPRWRKAPRRCISLRAPVAGTQRDGRMARRPVPVAASAEPLDEWCEVGWLRQEALQEHGSWLSNSKAGRKRCDPWGSAANKEPLAQKLGGSRLYSKMRTASLRSSGDMNSEAARTAHCNVQADVQQCVRTRVGGRQCCDVLAVACLVR
jgi:hypothetical protein